MDDLLQPPAPHSATGLVYRQRNDINQHDQQLQRLARMIPDPVQEMGSSLIEFFGRRVKAPA